MELRRFTEDSMIKWRELSADWDMAHPRRTEMTPLILELMCPQMFLQQRPSYQYINTKNCSLSIALSAMDQKPQKSLKR